DISEKNRLAVQVNYLNDNREIGILGTCASKINEVGEFLGVIRRPNNRVEIVFREMISSGAVFIHPTVALRRSEINRHRLRYNEEFRYAQDKELWARALPMIRGAIIPDRLV